MNKFKLVLLICFFTNDCNFVLLDIISAPLSELEGENALAQMVVFVPSIIAYPVLFPIIWLLEIFLSFYNETLVLYGLAIFIT